MQRVQQKYYWPIMLVLVIILLILFINSLTLGSVMLPFADLMKALVSPRELGETLDAILFHFRIPRALTAIFAGAALAVSGLLMQTFFRNPLAGPYILGINSGASLGVALLIMAGAALPGAAYVLLSGMGQIVSAFSGAFLVLLLVLWIARKVQNHITLLIIGIMLGYTTGGLVSILIYFSRARDIQAFIFWTLGSFRGVASENLNYFIVAVLVGLLLAMLTIKALNCLLLGEDYAASMGINLKRSRALIIVSTALLAGVTTAFCGPVGFIGIAVPHVCRSLFGTSNHRIIFPACIVMGANLALLAEIISQLPGYQGTLPLNAVTALMGAPIVIWVIVRHKSF